MRNINKFYKNQYKCKICQDELTNTWRKRNLKKVAANARKNYRKLRLEILKQYGNKCICCGERAWEFLTIDHISGGGTRERRTLDHGTFYRKIRKLNFPKKDYRLLCYNCNCAIGIQGYCPHDK